MATLPLTQREPCMDRMDAAQVLLQVSPSMRPAPQKAASERAILPTGRLDALAALASRMEPGATIIASPSSSSDDDSEAMPPPPPRRRRLRSSSNPEGMEKWDSLRHERKHFVLPSSIIEEELAEANATENEMQETMTTSSSSSSSLPLKKRKSPSSVASPISDQTARTNETDMDPEELLRRARSRLLEDLSEGSMNGEKGILTLPHSLSKYKEVYNRNGRIGIYTPAERAAIIARFNSKRSRRVWNKKIRYNCRKNLADRRMRVKGRFVKRSVEKDMPNVNDPEAGFCPTEDQPYRRLRRHTIT